VVDLTKPEVATDVSAKARDVVFTQTADHAKDLSFHAFGDSTEAVREPKQKSPLSEAARRPLTDTPLKVGDPIETIQDGVFRPNKVVSLNPEAGLLHAEGGVCCALSSEGRSWRRARKDCAK